ncbi:ABC transporter ATP-binding protein [Streptomyces sp. NPDC050560]|uniref:ABC transporter ATP-binding protein n=1 Tax=Streptomyces sp. NPDC050560 TaxID=3365630 RepID=UPI0037A34E3C
MSVIEITNLRKEYGDKVAVDDVSLSVDQGEIFGILGRNGAGKTTTVELLAGLRHRDGGSVRVLGHDPQTDTHAVRMKVGIQLQESELADKIRVHEALTMWTSFYPDPADPEELLRLLDLTDKRNTPFKKLSGGQKQRLSIALALIGRPEVAILDELTTGLDPQARRDTWSLIESIRDTGVTIVLVTHFMEEAERLCDRLAIIEQGRIIAEDTPAGLVSQVDAGQRLRFRTEKPLDDSLLDHLPEVTSIEHTKSQVIVAGTGNLLQAVSAELARHDITALDLRVEQTNLEDAFVALTGRGLHAGVGEAS